MKHPALKIIALAAAAAFCGAASAASPLSGTFQVTAQVNDSCNTLTTNNVAFGTYDPFLATVIQVNATFQWFCTKGTTFSSVDLVAASGGVGARTMTNGTSTISYELYQPSAQGAAATCPYTATWGAGTPTGAGKGFAVAASTSKATALVLKVCGQTTQGSDVTAGAYTDTVTININFT